MQLHGPTDPVDTIPVEPYGTSGNVALRFPASVSLILTSAADADRLIIAATQAKDLLLVTKPEGDEPGNAERTCLAMTARDGVTFRCRLHGDHEGPHQSAGWPPVTWVFGEPAEDVETTCTRTRPGNGIYRCTRDGGHEGSHEDVTGCWWVEDGAQLDNRVAPFPHLPHLAEHQGGRPDCIICGIDHDAAARLAPPAGYGLPSIEKTGGAS